MNSNYDPENKFEQWTVDNINYIKEKLDNHLVHHAKLMWRLLIPILIGVLGLIVKLYVL